MSTPPDRHPRIGRGFRLQFEPVQDAWVLLYPEGMVRLNASGAEILRRCDGKTPVSAIIDDLRRSFRTDVPAADVQAFIDLAQDQRWLEMT